ncbi:hypothetical protein PVAG01_01309 [Phlyctema vagabunda]|uniref:Ketoreductase domain-containing protein n=1 Tax=Phlyctema vagabunda TaxID=108571 RepID=A0ABR4PWR5_9HELO
MAFPPYTKTFHTSSYPEIDPSRSELSTAGKVVLITGGGSGIGPRIVHAFARSGATKISILGRTESSLLATKKEVETAYPKAQIYTAVADIADAAAVEKAFAETEKVLGKIDIFISNAAQLPDPGVIAKADVENWFSGFVVNVKGTVILAQAFLKHAAEHPTLVHVSTGAIHVPPMESRVSAYVTSKLAAQSTIDHFADENPHVRVHSVHPGVIASGMNQKAAESGLVLPYDDSKSPYPPGRGSLLLTATS